MSVQLQQGGVLDPAGGDILLHFFCAFGDQVSINTVCYQYHYTAGTTMRFGEVALATDTLIRPLYLPMLTDQASYIGTKCSPAKKNALELPGVVGGSDAGTVTGTPLPKQTCGMLTLLGLFSGPAFRGRLYLPFPAALHQGEDGHPNVSYAAQVNTLADALIGNTAIVGADSTIAMTLALWHRVAQNSTTVTETRTRLRWGEQHRRGDYGKTNYAGVI